MTDDQRRPKRTKTARIIETATAMTVGEIRGLARELELRCPEIARILRDEWERGAPDATRHE